MYSVLHVLSKQFFLLWFVLQTEQVRLDKVSQFIFYTLLMVAYSENEMLSAMKMFCG